jgi:hypothetical protein
MKAPALIPTALLLAMVLSTDGAAAAPSFDEAPLRVPQAAPQVWLEGPFGRVEGGTVGQPAGAPPEGGALDAYMRGAPVSLEVAVPFEDLLTVRVVARPVDGVAAEESLSDGATTFQGPSSPGGNLIVATIETEPFGTTQHAWLVDVPDRDYTHEAPFEITAPGVELISDAGITAGAPGDGCYLYFCADMGEPPPPESLAPLHVGVGETLVVRTDDGSGLAGWNGQLTPLAGLAIDSVTAKGPVTDTTEATLSLAGLEAPAAGEWLLEVRVVFDRERGHQWQTFRLDAR